LHQISAQHNGIGEILFNDAWSKTLQEEYRLMKRTLLMLAALTFSLALFVPLTSARTNVPGSIAQEPTPEEAAAYKAWYDANAAKDYPKAMELAKAYLQKFPNGNAKNIDYLKKTWIPSVRGMQYKKAAEEKNVAEVIRIGKEVLAEDPDNLDYIWAVLLQIRTNELTASPGNFAHGSDATDLAQRAIRLFEGGKTLTGVDPKSFILNVTLAYLHQTLALIHDHNKDTDKALAEYAKAAELDPTNVTYFFHSGRIYNDKYFAAFQKHEAAQKKVDAIPEADRNAVDPKPEVKAALEEAKAAFAEVKSRAEPVINNWARYLGLTSDKPNEARTTVLGAVTGLYKFLNNNSDAGLQKLIDDNKTSPTPVKMSPPAQAAAPPKPAAEPTMPAKVNGKKPH
jgi:tetratricopeptide (TPR) repeat protein